MNVQPKYFTTSVSLECHLWLTVISITCLVQMINHSSHNNNSANSYLLHNNSAIEHNLCLTRTKSCVNNFTQSLNSSYWEPFCWSYQRRALVFQQRPELRSLDVGDPLERLFLQCRRGSLRACSLRGQRSPSESVREKRQWDISEQCIHRHLIIITTTANQRFEWFHVSRNFYMDVY